MLDRKPIYNRQEAELQWIGSHFIVDRNLRYREKEASLQCMESLVIMDWQFTHNRQKTNN